jgi:FkbM family methyltransferase
MDNVILSPIVFSDLLAKATSYHFNVRPITLRDQKCLVDASLSWLSDLLRGLQKPLESYLRCNMIVKTWDGFLFMVRARTPDLYTVAVAERYELENWFKPYAKGVVADVGAYIGTYTVRAMHTADLVIAIEPLPLNYKALQINVELNDRRRKAEIISINKAVAETKGKTRIFLPIEFKYIGSSIARLERPSKQSFIEFDVEIDTLDNTINKLGVGRIDLMKIDIEGYVSKALPGMVESLKKTKWLIVELWKRDLPVIRMFKHLGFRLVDRYSGNFLFKNENAQ